jgi:hypothetical protein
MEGLTRKQLIALILIGIAVSIAVNVLMAGRAVDCDWRHGITKCQIVNL